MSPSLETLAWVMVALTVILFGVPLILTAISIVRLIIIGG